MRRRHVAMLIAIALAALALIGAPSSAALTGYSYGTHGPDSFTLRR